LESNTRILFVCPDINKPSGGIKQIYRQVDVLCKNGFNAHILHEAYRFKCTWFDNATPIVYNASVFQELNSLKQRRRRTTKEKIKYLVKNFIKFCKSFTRKNHDIELNTNDILVFPEIYGPRLAEVKTGINKVIYNQGAYQTFFGYNLNLQDTDTPYHHKDIIGVVVNSEDARQYMNLAFPKLKTYRVKYGFDSDRFSINSSKKKQICFMPRRLRSDIIQVINILKFNKVLEGWTIRPIENMNEDEVAECMKESAIFLSFNINEGFGMPPAEAMACGCIVVGYPGQGGNEIFSEKFCFPVKDRDVKAYVKTLEKVIKAYEDNPKTLLNMANNASNHILSSYSMTEEENTIIETWTRISDQNN